MSKTNKKTEKLHTESIQLLYERYDVSKDYIRKSIRGDRNGRISIRIAEEYKILVAHSNKAIKEAQKQLDQ